MTKYETPTLTALTPAINAIHSTTNKMPPLVLGDAPYPIHNEGVGGYADWED
jgi:hypothetical protein